MGRDEITEETGHLPKFGLSGQALNVVCLSSQIIEIGDMLFDIADKFEIRKLIRFSEQRIGVSLSKSNNVSEGSGSALNKEFSIGSFLYAIS